MDRYFNSSKALPHSGLGQYSKDINLLNATFSGKTHLIQLHKLSLKQEGLLMDPEGFCRWRNRLHILKNISNS